LEKLILASPSSSIEILEVLNITPLAAMGPKSLSFCHPTNAEEEDPRYSNQLLPLVSPQWVPI
jgi:hypothetical protein